MHTVPHCPLTTKLLLCTQIGVYMSRESRELRHTCIHILWGLSQVFSESLGNKIVTGMNSVNYSLERLSGKDAEFF